MSRDPMPARPVRRTWDFVLGIAAVVVLLATAAVLGFAGAFLTMASDACGSAVVCATGQLGAGLLVAVFGPALVALLAVVGWVVQLVRARISFWVPLAGLLAAVLIWAAGAALVFAAVPSSA